MQAHAHRLLLHHLLDDRPRDAHVRGAAEAVARELAHRSDAHMRFSARPLVSTRNNVLSPARSCAFTSAQRAQVTGNR